MLPAKIRPPDMAIPSIEDFTDLLFSTSDAALGDTISYKPAGGSFASVKAFVDYGEALRDAGGTGMIIDTDISVAVSKLEVAEEPKTGVRIILPKLPQVSFRPFNVRDMGQEWHFEVKRA